MPASPPARSEVESLHAYSAPLEGRRGLLRLDFNENTVGPSPKVVEAIRAIPGDQYAIYPEYDGLREAVLASLADMPGAIAADAPSTAPAPAAVPAVAPANRADGVPALATVSLPQPPALRPSLRIEQVGLFNGVDAAIQALFQAYGAPGDRLLTTSPTFGYYTPCARMQGMAIEAIAYELPGFGFPLAAIRDALNGGSGSTPPRLLLICNPNNPTGTRLAPERILELAAASPGTLVVVDELYEAFTGDSVLPASLALPNLLVLRSLSKTAGIAGLRIGFAIG
ncbi:MAG: aminotransferase class I/II-fold pyridoxal phosphate-dependent enzyme, partial [Cyanobium sp.]